MSEDFVVEKLLWEKWLLKNDCLKHVHKKIGCWKKRSWKKTFVKKMVIENCSQKQA